MQREIVERRSWVSRQEYKDGLAFAQLAPGPLAAQLAIYLGWRVPASAARRWSPSRSSRPSFLMVLGLAALYVRFGGMPWLQGAFYGVGAAVIAIIARARSSWRDRRSAATGCCGSLFADQRRRHRVDGIRDRWLFVAAGSWSRWRCDGRAREDAWRGAVVIAARRGSAGRLARHAAARSRAAAGSRHALLVLRLGRSCSCSAAGSRSCRSCTVAWCSRSLAHRAPVPRCRGRLTDHAGAGRDHRGVHRLSGRRPVRRDRGGGRRVPAGLSLHDAAGAALRRFATNRSVHAFVDGVTAAATGAIAGAAFVLGRRAVIDDDCWYRARYARVAAATLKDFPSRSLSLLRAL